MAIATCPKCGWSSERDHDPGTCATCSNPEMIETINTRLKAEFAKVSADQKAEIARLTAELAKRPPAPTGGPA